MTAQGLGTTMWGTIVVGVISFGLTIYSVYLNFRQAKVNEQMGKVIKILEQIRDKK